MTRRRGLWTLFMLAALLIPAGSEAQRRGRGGWGYPERRRDRRYGGAAFDNGHADGYEKGLDDGRDRRPFDPVRHRRYREGDRGYDGRYGSRAQYENVYRDAFRRGYEMGYRDGERSRRRGGDWPWPF